ncbi:putative sodium-dependent multivitamin transporter [Parasteatoda tepidariorum]|uniref:putative sodium-dependent multivitamin transporter n=1 Tax=Parasteatoda tepidariorum TaxID=114398 RepID=UPI00077F9E23|nr:putative sodium-dependent multivitamin transporter [Parasteatoda tepidariorum]XP_015913586.1 putative sodium-dependent multivitamin transporter [Parasteatoda tepidariorum]XP_015913587.1 putative sodium-dependent multivitamin transporter [Parasteatoda tepidariorum]
MEAEKAILGGWDYLMFSIMLLISAGIGVYFRFSGGKQKTTEEFLLAGKDMPILPVSFSIMATFLSAITIVGTPAEMYYFGIHMAYLNISYVIGIVISAYLTLPVFFEMQASTAYEYLERRFGQTARTIASLAFVLQMILYMSVVLYAPALALSAVTNLSTWVAIVSVGVVCTFYCTIGGMKAVLWTDVFQSLLMFLGISAVITKGFLDVGFYDVFKIANEGGRILIPGFEASFYTRYTVWNMLIQGIILSMTAFSANQVQIQRLLTVKNIDISRKALWYSIPLGCSFHLLACLSGVIVYSYFAECDPLTPPNNPIHKGDQLLPYFMIKSLGHFPGLPGICICGIFSASLSTVSSAVNSLTAVTMQDLVRPFLEAKGFSQDKLSFAAQVITMFFGVLCIALTFLVATFGSIIQASFIVFAILGGPVLGTFLLGMLTTRANEKGAVVGLLVSIAVASWISFSTSYHGPQPKILPVSVAKCPVLNISIADQLFLLNDTVLSSAKDIDKYEIPVEPKLVQSSDEDIFPLYRISYMWFAPIGFIFSFVIGYVTSILINMKTGKTKYVSPDLLSPAVKWFIHKSPDVLEKKEVKFPVKVELQAVYRKTKDNEAMKKAKESSSESYKF